MDVHEATEMNIRIAMRTIGSQPPRSKDTNLSASIDSHHSKRQGPVAVARQVVYRQKLDIVCQLVKEGYIPSV